MIFNLSRQLDISSVLAALLYQRGIGSVEEARLFLFGGLKDLSDPFCLTGMTAAVERIRLALRNQEKIVIYGDYDVDGICSVVLLKECLTLLHGQVDYYVPNRFSEGYGINEQAIRTLAAQGYSLLISVDCGITSIKEVALANSLGMDSIITDHHTPLVQLPAAAAVINPRLDENAALLHLAGVGVAFMLARGLGRGVIADETMFGWLELAALATIADVVPLVGENRILVREGLPRLKNTSRTGLQALLQETGLRDKPLSPWHVSFVLAPRLNSAGRLDNAAISIELLLGTDGRRCTQLARKICQLNEERKSIEEDILQQALQQIDMKVDLENELFLVLAGEGWHHGVLGIVASRLCEKFRRPAFLISWEGDTGRGSGRSIAGLDIYQALDYGRQHLIQFGGHKMAAGLSIRRDQLEDFKKAVTVWVRQNVPALPPQELHIDVEIDSKDITAQLCHEIELMQPFGEGNSEPALVVRGCEISSLVRVGKNGEHLKFNIGTQPLNCIAFNHQEWLNLPLHQCRQDLVFGLGFNEFRGHKTVQLKIKDMKCAFWPDSGLPSDTDPKIEFNRMAARTAKELQAGSPVVYLYPTCRSLAKHKLAVTHYFTSAIVHVLHGQLRAADRETACKALSGGEPRLYMITRTYFQHLRRENWLPANLSYIIRIWPDQPLADQKLLTEYDVDILPAVKPSPYVAAVPDWTVNPGRKLIYTNRSKTVHKLQARLAESCIEAGVNDLETRRSVRRSFSNCANGALFWDGSSSCLPAAGEVTELVLADVPYGAYELFGAYREIAAAGECPTVLAFEPEDLEFNRNYLSRICPSPEMIQAVWKYLISLPGNSLRQDINILLMELRQVLQIDLMWADLVPILNILSDLDLCQMRKKGSIMEIKFINSDILIPDIKDSLYYLESQAEKALYYRFEEEITK